MITSMNGFNEAAVARVTAEADANARLIASRDELLAALKGLLGECEHAGMVSIPLSFDIRAIAYARAAIARAEGR